MAEKSKRQHKARARKDRSPLELTAFQKLFVTEYLVDLNGAAATKRAGSRAKDLKKVADTLLSTPKVAAAIADGMKKRVERAEVTADQVIAELKRIAFANIGDFVTIEANGKEKGQAAVDLSRASREQLAVISEIRVEDIDSGRRTGRRTVFKLHDKISALQLLGKHLGIFVERKKVEHNVSLAELENVSRRLEDKLIDLVAARYSQNSTRTLQ